MSENEKIREQAEAIELAEGARPQQQTPEETSEMPQEQADGPAQEHAGGQAEALTAELASLREELEAARQDILYARAETQNVRRRLEKEIADARAYAATSFARDILSVSDNLARAIEAVPADLREDGRLKGLVAGIEATMRELDKVFAQHGISRIAALGLPLDPNQHQAMLEVPHAEAAPGTVVQEMQAGYMIRDRLLRPALVAVAKAPD